MTEKDYLILLTSFIAFGPARSTLMVNFFGSAKKSWRATPKQLSAIGLSNKLVSEFTEYRKQINPTTFFSNLTKLGVSVITQNESEYPQNLLEIEDKPLVLYVRGSLTKNDENAIAIVGSRKMTSYGRDVTEKLSAELANIGVTIVSGLAFGVDITSHKSALDAGGRCIAVMASGIDIVTPRSNEWLGKKILASGGAIVSEYPPGTVPQRQFFPYRNRIISGLSRAVVVVEGMIKSGTIHTAKHAADQGRQVFAVPGPITSPMSQAPHYLIKNGAKMVTDVADILEELNLQLAVDKEKMEKLLPADSAEAKIIGVLEKETLHLDEIARILDMSVSEISARLTIMELKGLVKSLGNGVYKRA
ncbi:MAG: protecting protein DprA protein [Candidatus Woesebacteria bacterium GW2011_GWA1_39_8]|jgi:DNA processing protein|uniref:Protecting protein DprA protein n=1 Tax=Candidatus Woesebacteria bacterium GW2011_GWA1_39_8 TaxID=1618552 RepID=A0A0G0PJQ2_9BACT|nr:MAG: protecting protein DprA protein [Candidatus Woesebacteria bacterium GW2011_GWA1_39_8]